MVTDQPFYHFEYAIKTLIVLFIIIVIIITTIGNEYSVMFNA